jgi:hypothetical protein
MKTIITPISLLCVILFSSCNQKQEAKTETTPPVVEKKVVEAVVIQPQTESDTLKGSLKALEKGKIGNTVVSNARIARDKALYAETTGVLDVAQDVKQYVKSLFGATSPQYKQVSGLKFNRPKGD